MVSKVFRSSSIGLHSAYAQGDARVVYRKDEPATAPSWLAEKGYHLTGFRTVERAIEFALTLPIPSYTFPEIKCEFVEVWECEGETEVALPVRAHLTGLPHRRLDLTLEGWPRGTVMYETITLQRHILHMRLDKYSSVLHVWSQDEPAIEHLRGCYELYLLYSIRSLSIHRGES